MPIINFRCLLSNFFTTNAATGVDSATPIANASTSGQSMAFAAEEFREPLRVVVREQVYSTNCGHPH